MPRRHGPEWRSDRGQPIAAGIIGLALLVLFNATSGSDGVGAQSAHPTTLAAADGTMTAGSSGSDAVAALAKISDYHTARWHPLHFKPAIDTATNEQCLACHKEVLDSKVRAVSPAGLTAANALAWYQTLDTYEGEQVSFHARHLTTDYAKSVMSLKCTFCHQGNDPREEAPGGSSTQPASTATAGFTLRKMVDPSATCLMCHGKFPGQNMGFEDQPWHLIRDGMETPEAPNGCLTCHAAQFRTVRHQVNYLNAKAIEDIATSKSDTCFGCHGGRSWFRKSYPYPRHGWPGMDPTVPDWAKDRPTESKPEHVAGVKK